LEEGSTLKNLLLILGSLLIGSISFADPVTIFGPQKFSASPASKETSLSIPGSANDLNGVLTVINGDGRDLEPLTCSGGLPKRLECLLENVERLLVSELQRPEKPEIYWNGQLIVSRSNLPQTKGKLQLAIKVQKQNTLKLQIKGLPTSYLSVDIKSESSTVNQLPMARMTMTPTTGIAPELISFSGLTSSDPDGDAISSYEWEFGDGGVATGALVTHQYISPGTFSAKLTVTDSKGGRGSVVQSVVIKPNQVPIAGFTAVTDTALGVLKAHFDASASKDNDGSIVSYLYDFGDGTTASTAIADHIYNQPGTYQVKLTVTDNKNGTGTQTQSLAVQDTTPPVLALQSPESGSTLRNFNVPIAGSANEPLSEVIAQLDGEAAVSLSLGSDLKSFSQSITAGRDGNRTLQISARDKAGNRSVISTSFTINASIPPLAKLSVTTPASNIAPLMALFDASKSSSPQGKTLRYHFDFGDGVEADSENGIISHQFQNAGSFTATVHAIDTSGLESTAQVQITATQPSLPPPAEVQAPPLATSGLQPMIDTVRFLYEGSNPIQTNVQANAIDPMRVAVLQGTVVDNDQNPLSGVKVTILEAPEVGQTMTDENGNFHIVANGGATLSVNYERNGYFPAQRKVSTTAMDYFTADKVVLVKPDSKVSQVQNNSAQIQMVKGSTVSDQSGERTGVLVIPAGTEAKLQMPDGTLKTTPTLSLRVSEYSVGSDGPKRMPAALPGMTGYTYAVEISADEAIANGAQHVVFSKPVPYYIDNFLNYPIGSAIPVGSFESKLGAWIPENDGIAVKVLDIQNGSAVLTLDESSEPAPTDKLAKLNITSEELTQIAQAYPVGKSFWRVQLKHLSPYDFNSIATIAQVDPPADPPQVGDGDTPPNGPPTCVGSIIGLMNCSLGEAFDLPGIPGKLHYSTMTKPGRTVENTIVVPLWQGDFPASSSVNNVHIKIEVAGQAWQHDYPPKRDLVAVWTWNGQDAFGRYINGAQTAHITIDYDASGFYRIGPYSYLVDLKSFGTGFISALQSFIPTRSAPKFTRQYVVSVGNGVPLNSTDIAGWNISHVHTYNPTAKTLYLGTGEVINGSTMAPIVNRIAGSYNYGPLGDGGPAMNASFGAISQLAVGPDSSIYVADSANYRIRKIGPDGIVQTIIGDGTDGIPGDGQLASESKVSSIAGLAVSPSGVIYFSSQIDSRIYKIDTNGIVSIVAGSDSAGNSGDFGLARNARLNYPSDLTLGPDGTLYFIDSGNRRVRKVTPDGQIFPFAATETTYEASGDEGSALAATFNFPTHLAMGLNGEVYVVDSDDHTVRVITNDGIIHRFAGIGEFGKGEENIPATESALNQPRGIDVDRDGSVFISDFGNSRVRKISQSGVINTIAGGLDPVTNVFTTSFIARSQPIFPVNLKTYQHGTFIYASDSNRVINLYHEPLPDLNISGYSIGSKDGSEVYQFSPLGQHLRTLFAKTGKTKWSFSYDANGHLLSMKDSSGNITAIQRDANGNPSSINGPFGHHIGLSVDSAGYLASVILPTGETTHMAYTAGGLLAEFKKPSGSASTFVYNRQGELLYDTDATGASTILQKLRNYPSPGQYTVFHTTPMARQSLYRVDRSSYGNSVFEWTKPDGQKQTQYSSVYNDQTSYSNGSTRYSTMKDIDPRLGGITQFFAFNVDTGRKGTVVTRKTTSYTPLSTTDFFKFNQKVETTDSTGGIVTTSYNSQQRTISSVTGLGQSVSAVIDDFERPMSFQIGNQLPVQLVYNTKGFLASAQQGDRLTQFTYNTLGQLVSLTDPEGQVTNLQYDLSNRVLSQKGTDGNSTGFTYDLNGNLTGIQPPDKALHSFLYDLVDLFSIYTPPAVTGGGGPSKYIYNRDRQISKEVKPDGSEIVYTYNSDTGQIEQVTGALKSISYTFGGYSSTVPETSISSDGIQLLISPEENLHLDRSYSGNTIGRVRYEMGANQLVKTIFINEQVQVPFVYNQDSLATQVGDLTIGREVSTGSISSTQIGNVQEQRSLNDFGEITQDSFAAMGSGIYSATYTRDKLGRIKTKAESILGATKIYGYTYDLAGRLTDVSVNGQASSHYTYDANGNRLSENTVSATYDTQDRLVQYGSTSYTFTANGTLSQKQSGSDVTKYLYDEFGQLAMVTLPNGKKIDYLIDGEKHRSVKLVDGVVTKKFIFNANGTVAAELYPNNSLKSAFIYATASHSPDYMINGGVTYRFIKDQLGSIRLVFNTVDGTVVQKIDYNEFGKVLQDTSPGLQPFGFAGGLYDEGTGLVRFGARDYDPETGRWTSKDPILFGGGDTNLYGYVMSDPVNLIDPSGLKPGDKFSNPADAAKDALDFIWNQSQQNGWEYSGGIYQNKDGTYSATVPTTLKNPFSSQFKWGQAGSYHTHPMVCDDRGISLEPNSFSGPDINLADANHITVFMMGPNRRLNTYRGK
jgi:RHS repeat-associated protein